MTPFQFIAVVVGTVALNLMAYDLWNTFSDMRNQQRRERTRQRAPRNSSAGQENVPEALRCAVCLVNMREVMIEPCNHVSLCADCGDTVRRCPICNGPKRNIKTVYIS